MKKVLIMLTAMFTAVIFSEIFIRYILKYPSYTGYKKYLLDKKLGPNNYLNWFNPYYKFWNVEGGNKVQSFNNIGLPGNDISISKESKYVFVLGSSFIEAVQIRRDEIATSIFQKKIKQIDPYYQVINLGRAISDPYASWFRLLFYKKYFSPSYVILTIDNFLFIKDWMDRYKKPLDFSYSKNFGEVIPANKIKSFVYKFREYSAFFNLLIDGIKRIYSGKTINWMYESPEKTKDNISEISESLKNSINMFKKMYSDKFFVVSFSENDICNKLLGNFCKENCIPFYADASIIAENNRIDNKGHFNQKGNLLLGEFLFDSFIDKIDRGNRPVLK